MTDKQLSLPERAVLLALATFVGEVSNKELRERFAFTLDGKDRIHLTECGFVSSRRGTELPGHPYVHELTESGWRRAGQELAAEAPERAAKGYRLLYGFVNIVERFMSNSGLTLADIVTGAEAKRPDAAEQPVDTARAPETAETADVTDAGTRIRAAYAEIADKPGLPVRLLPLRERLADLPAAEFDAALLRLAREPGVFLEPEPKLRSLTDADRKASIRVGGEIRHVLSIEPS
jgi:hypothetical protein